ncbi:hypothetical protein GCM10027613_23350 [Microlunatus endophyticus]
MFHVWHGPPGWPDFGAGFAPPVDFRPDWQNWTPIQGWSVWWRPDDASELVDLIGSFEPMPSMPKQPEFETAPPIWVAPPGWPVAPDGWVPPMGWSPPRDWPPAPSGWQFWQPDHTINANRFREWKARQTSVVRTRIATPAGAWFWVNEVETQLMIIRARHQAWIGRWALLQALWAETPARKSVPLSPRASMRR